MILVAAVISALWLMLAGSALLVAQFNSDELSSMGVEEEQ